MSSDPNTLANVITAVAAVLTAVGGIILALGVLLPTLRKVAKVEHIVNQDRTDRLNFQRALIRALKDAGVPVPVDQSIKEEEL